MGAKAGATAAEGRAVTKFLDLFSGIGAMRLGFEWACRDAGLSPLCVGFSEIDEPAIGVYLRHFPGTPALGDVRALAASGSIPECDVILAGFPCPPWSMAGDRRGFRDERGKLFFALAKIIGRCRPQAFLLENVRGLESHNRGKTLAGILDILRGQLGYAVRHASLNSRDFGVPQNRPRVYIVGFSQGCAGFEFPAATDPTKTIRDVLEADPVDPRHYVTEQALARMRRHKARHEQRGNGFGFRMLDAGKDVVGTLLASGFGREQSLVVDPRIARFPHLPGRLSPVNRECVRELTPTEWERLQGLPDGYTAGQADVHRYRQLGNAVTVPVVTAISRSLLAAMGPSAANTASILIPDRTAPPTFPLTSVEVCTGCGGLSRGLTATGLIDVRVACELDHFAAESYRMNHPRATMVEKDLAKEETRCEIVRALGGRRCDLLAAGLPCQAYSLSGCRDPDDPRASLFEHFLRLMRILAPRVAIIENVPGILSMQRPDGTSVVAAIARAFRGLGYAAGHHVVNSADFGDPQRRTRVVIFGWREGKLPRFEPTHDEHGRGGLPKWRTVRDAIGDLEDAPEDSDAWHVFVKSSKEYVERIRRTPVGQSVADGYGESFYRNPPDEPAITVKANNGGVLVHYAKDRLMTPRELARLQGFDDSCRFAGSKSDVLRQIGNAVPVGLAMAIGRAVAAMLRP